MIIWQFYSAISALHFSLKLNFPKIYTYIFSAISWEMYLKVLQLVETCYYVTINCGRTTIIVQLTDKENFCKNVLAIHFSMFRFI